MPFGPLAAGRHHIDVPLYASFRTYVVMGDGSGPNFGDPIAVVRVTFEVPAGWSGNGGAITKDACSPSALAMSPWTVSELHRAPGRPSPSHLLRPSGAARADVAPADEGARNQP